MMSREYINEVCELLRENRAVRKSLPGGGLINIDRKLPFLVVYRQPRARSDQGTDRLVRGEASFLLCSDPTGDRKGLSNLLASIIEAIGQDFRSFLVIEIWSGNSPMPVLDPDSGRTPPSFRLHVSSKKIPDETIVAIEKALRRITVSKKAAVVSTEYVKKQWPDEFPSLLLPASLRANNPYLLGIEVSPIFRDPDNGELFPLVLKKIHRGLSVALKMGAYEFARKRAGSKPDSFRSLGKRAVVKSVWEVDRNLSEISNVIEFLLLTTPVNIDQSWEKFRKGKFQKEPVFFYRPVPFDPLLLKRRLYGIPLDKVEDPTLYSLFHEKAVETELMISMVRDRSTKNFIYGSLQLYGAPDQELIGISEKILTALPARSRENGKKRLNAAEFADRARAEIDHYRGYFPGIESRVLIREDITGLLVSRGNLHVGARLKVPVSRGDALIQHEVGTHVLTYVNGANQPLKQLYSGLAGNDELQEGLAVLSEYLVGGLSVSRLRLLAGRVVAARNLVDGASFTETFRDLHLRFGFAQRTSYIVTARIYRSGGLTKDAVYLRGLVKLLEYLRGGGELEPLYMGKMALDDVALVSELRLREVLHDPVLTPRFLGQPEARSRLDGLQGGELIYGII